MTIKQTYDFLFQIKTIDNKIWNTLTKCDALRSCLLPSGIRYDLDKIQTSQTDHMSEIESQVLDLEKEVLELQLQKRRAIESITESINMLDDDNEQSILIGYYIGRKKMKDIADSINYSLSHAYVLKRKAVAHLSKVIR